MKVLYWADSDSPKLAQVRGSASAHGIEAEPIGIGTMVPNWHQSLFKQRSLYDAVRGLDGGELVLVTDGYDAFFQQGPGYIREQFGSFGCDVVFSAERGYIHQYRRYKGYFDRAAGPSPYKYLNAGGVVGYAGALRKLYEPTALLMLKLMVVRSQYLRRALHLVTAGYERWFLPPVAHTGDPASYLRWFSYTDQAYMTRCMVEGWRGVSIGLDRECRLFWCTAFEWEEIDRHCRLVGGRLENAHTGRAPACIHVPWESQHRAVFLDLYGRVYRPCGGSAA